MKAAAKCKLVIDAAMAIARLLLMAYGLIGEKSHEWIGVGMLILFIAHHIANRKWYGAIGKGRYTKYFTDLGFCSCGLWRHCFHS